MRDDGRFSMNWVTPNKGMNLTRSAPATGTGALAGYPRCYADRSGAGGGRARLAMREVTTDEITLLVDQSTHPLEKGVSDV